MTTVHRQRIGLLGGSFNPIHHGHLIMAQRAFERYALNRVLLIPCAIPPHKPAEALLPGACRRAMIACAIENDPRFALSDSELDRTGVSYSIDTVTTLRAAYPDAEVFFIIGEDSLAELHTWRCIDALLEACTVVTFRRRAAAGTPATVPCQLPEAWRQRLLAHITDGPCIDISSSQIRDRVARGLPIRYLTPDAVAAYIARHHLYREPSR